jgi:hypothetical protein
MATPALKSIFDILAEGLDIPRSYYQRAAERYSSIEKWLRRPASTVAKFNPRVYAQGSFRLGTVTRPVLAGDEYDLDIVCEFKLLSVDSTTQKQLKQLLGDELKAYVRANGIESPIAERNRCWRIDYADEVNFHIDNLPCVPHHANQQRLLEDRGVAGPVARQAIALTCKTHPQFDQLTRDWPTSNPNGFAIWFEQCFGAEATTLREQVVRQGLYRLPTDVPTFELKTPLQIAVQILKRHRDFMFRENAELKPISMILTTLAAHAYKQESSPEDAVVGIVERMASYVRPTSPRIPNPVNPAEDFADKWAAKPALEENFWRWQMQASQDFAALANPNNAPKFRKLVEDRFGLQLPSDRPSATVSSAPIATSVVVRDGPKPWGR